MMAKTLGLDIGPAPEPKTSQRASKKVFSNTQRREAGKPMDLNFKVSAEFKREFKTWAVSHDLSQKETLEKAFSLLKKHGV
jgi:hypothetical protein